MKSRLQIAFKFVFFFIALLVMGGCKPDKLTIEIYSSDVEIAASGKEIIDCSKAAWQRCKVFFSRKGSLAESQQADNYDK